MKIKFWGVRGSLPATSNLDQNKQHIHNLLASFIRAGYKSESDIQSFFDSKAIPEICGYGQNTTCVQVSDGSSDILIDGGSGLKVYGDHTLKQNPEKTQHHIIMSHFHYDHIMGLPFFSQHFMPGQEIHYYAVQPYCEDVVRSLFSRPLFPLNYESLSAKIFFHKIKPYVKTLINGFEVSAYRLDHPDPCYGFRIEKNGKTYAHAVDHEADRIVPADLGPDADLFKNVDLLYIDAQYTESDMTQKKGWGHGTYDRVFEICSVFGIKQALMAHHDPGFSISDIQNLVEQSRRFFKEKAKSKNIEDLKWSFAYDGQVVEL